MRPGESIVAGLRADAALNLIELTTGIGLLLRQLVQESAISRARSCSCCAWRLDSSSWLLTCRISGSAHRRSGRLALARLFAQIIELGTQALKQFGEIVDNVLILTGALEDDFRSSSAFSADCRTSTVSGWAGFAAFACSVLGYLFSIRGCRSVRPETEAQGQQESVYQAHGITLC